MTKFEFLKDKLKLDVPDDFYCVFLTLQLFSVSCFFVKEFFSLILNVAVITANIKNCNYF